MTTVATLAALAGLYALYRMGSEGRRFLVDLVTDLVVDTVHRPSKYSP